MGLFDKIKNLITKKEKTVEEVKEEFQVDEVSEIEEVKEEKDINTVEDDDWVQFVNKQQKIQAAQDIDSYDKGLEKTRKEFVSKLSMLGIKYTKINEEYFEELDTVPCLLLLQHR